MNEATENWMDLQLTIFLDQIDLEIRKNITYIKFTEIGKDQEQWAGNYGSQFSCERMLLIIHDDKKNILKMIRPRRIYELPIQTYFNDGIGKFCYIDGQKYLPYKGYYNNLNDLDFSLAYQTKKISNLKLGNQAIQLTSNFELSLCEREAWNGSSCLQINGLLENQQSMLIKFYKTNINPKGTLYLSINVKNIDLKIVTIHLVLAVNDKKQLKFELSKSSINNGWDSIQFLVPQQGLVVKGIYLLIQNLKLQRIPLDLLMGGFALYDDQLNDIIKANIDFKDPAKYVKCIQLKESLKNSKSLLKNIMLVDLYIQFEFGQLLSNIIKTVRVFKDKVWLTNCRAEYCHLTDIAFDLADQEFQVKLQLVLTNGLHIKVESTKPIVIPKEQIEIIE